MRYGESIEGLLLEQVGAAWPAVLCKHAIPKLQRTVYSNTGSASVEAGWRSGAFWADKPYMGQSEKGEQRSWCR